MALKPSAIEILQLMQRQPGWWSVRDIMDICPTNTPTKRMSELFAEGKVEKRRSPADRRFVEYKAKEAS